MRRGFSLIEMMMAVAILAVVIAMAMGGWSQFSHKAHYANTQAALDTDVRRTIERFRYEMRNSSRKTIIFYPDEEPYQAISFALPADADGDGLMDMDGSNLVWRQSVVYHVWNHSPHQIRRTLFNNRNQEASYDDRYDQVAAVVSQGDGSGACLAGEDSSTMVLFENLFTGRLWHATAQYDGYAPVPNTRQRVTFGSLPLSAGEHKINFTIVGRNSAASGRRLRLDRVVASVAGWPFEAEHRTTEGVGGTAPDFVGQGLASAAYGLMAPTSSEGDTLSVTVYNDAIEECLFIGEGRNIAASNTVVRFDETFKPAGTDFQQGVMLTCLDGQFGDGTWKYFEQTGKTLPDEFAGSSGFAYFNSWHWAPPSNCVVRIPIMSDTQRDADVVPIGYGIRSDGYGPVFRLYKSPVNNGLEVLNPSFAILAPDDVPTDDNNNLQPILRPEDQVPLQFWQNGELKIGGWKDCNQSPRYLELRPEHLVQIPMGATLMLQFQVKVNTPNIDRLVTCKMKEDRQLPGCWSIPADTADLLDEPNWHGQSGLVRHDFIPALMFMTLNHADGGEYISHIYDTKSQAPKTFEWSADVPAGSTLTLYARSGHALTPDGFNIAGALDWASVSPVSSGGSFVENTGRYVQFRAVFTSQPSRFDPATGIKTGTGNDGPYRTDTPRLLKACFKWDGEEKYVDIAADLLKSPDCGIFKVDVDGRALIQGVTMEIEIFKDVRSQGGRPVRLRSAMVAEINPRNENQ